MKNIITISRQFGADGSTIGKKVAERLGYYYCDKDMIIRAALESGTLTPEEVHFYDEKVPMEFGISQSLFNFYNLPLDKKLFKAQTAAIKKVAEKRNCVIVGRNGNIVLQEYDRTLHVFISATEYARIRRVQQDMPELSDTAALKKIQAVDRARIRYCRHYTNTEFGNGAYYDLSLKSSTLGIDNCVDLICAAANT